MDITDIPMARGFVYLAAVVDWFSRRVLSWQLSITMEVEFCLDAVEDALARHGRPAIFTPTRAEMPKVPRAQHVEWQRGGSQFISEAFTGLLRANGIAIGMDGRGAR